MTQKIAVNHVIAPSNVSCPVVNATFALMARSTSAIYSRLIFVFAVLLAYDLATSRDATHRYARRPQPLMSSLESHSTPVSRPHSRQSDISNTSHASNASTASTHPMCGSLGTSSTSSMDVVDGPRNVDHLTMQPPNVVPYAQWQESVNDSERLALTLDEIVHIRSVMTKAELEGLPVDVQIKEDVEKRKVCFLCLRTRFSLFAWGVQCKLCARTVCSKCYSKVNKKNQTNKIDRFLFAVWMSDSTDDRFYIFYLQMRIPTDEFRNVPVALLSPSLLCTPQSSTTPSPSEDQSYGEPTSMMDDGFPRSLIERLLRTDSTSKVHFQSASKAICFLQFLFIFCFCFLFFCILQSTVRGNSTLRTPPSGHSPGFDGPKSLPPQSANYATLDRR